jgi:hypothetical protein
VSVTSKVDELISLHHRKLFPTKAGALLITSKRNELLSLSTTDWKLPLGRRQRLTDPVSATRQIHVAILLVYYIIMSVLTVLCRYYLQEMYTLGMFAAEVFSSYMYAANADVMLLRLPRYTCG